MEFSPEERTKLLWELHRIGNALEVLAIQGDTGFMPMEEDLKVYRRDLNHSRSSPTRRPTPPARGKP